jgi:hypothetical protein
MVAAPIASSESLSHSKGAEVNLGSLGGNEAQDSVKFAFV